MIIFLFWIYIIKRWYYSSEDYRYSYWDLVIRKNKGWVEVNYCGLSYNYMGVEILKLLNIMKNIILDIMESYFVFID